MKKLHYSTTIDASPQKVWEILLGKDTYPQWTKPFSEDSRVETDWKEGSRAIFRGGNSDDGMIARIATNKPNEFLSIEHLGMIKDGKEDLTSDEIKKWAGAKENYTLTEKDGQTVLDIDMDADEEWAGHFDKQWPEALKIAKDLAERE